MCRVVEEMIEKEKKEMVLRMIKDDVLSLEKIATYVDLPIGEVEKLAESAK